MPHALNELASQQSKGTEETTKAMLHFLDCAATHPDAEKAHRASETTLAVGGGAACLVAPQAGSRAGGFHCLADEDGSMSNGSSRMRWHQLLMQKQKPCL